MKGQNAGGNAGGNEKKNYLCIENQHQIKIKFRF